MNFQGCVQGCEHDLRKGIEVLAKLVSSFSIKVFNMMKLLVVLFIMKLIAQINVFEFVKFPLSSLIWCNQFCNKAVGKKGSQRTFNCSNSIIEMLEKVSNMFKINQKDTRATSTSQGRIQSEFGLTKVRGTL